MLDTRPVLLVAVILALLLATFIEPYVHAAGTGVHLKGRVSAIAEEAEEGRFQIIGDNGSVTLDVSAWDYMIDYLRAANGRVVTLTIDPE